MPPARATWWPTGVTGRLIEATDVTGYADALAALIADPAARAAAGQAGHQAAAALSWDGANGAVLDAYHAVLARRGRGRG